MNYVTKRPVLIHGKQGKPDTEIPAGKPLPGGLKPHVIDRLVTMGAIEEAKSTTSAVVATAGASTNVDKASANR